MTTLILRSTEHEQYVLGDLLARNESFDQVGSLLEARHFSSPAHARIWTVIASQLAASKPVDALTVYDILRSQGFAEECGGLPYLNELSQCVYTSRNTRRFAESLVTMWTARELIDAADQAKDIAVGEGEIAEKVDRITSLFDQIQRKQVRKVPKHIAEIAFERIEHYTDLERGEVKPGWRTHIPWLTTTLNGGFRPGGLYILAARPSVGKSSFSQELGMMMAQDGLTTLFLSQEMADTEVADRSVSNAGRLSYASLLTGKMERDGWERATEAMERLGKLPFYVDDQASLTLSDIRIKAKSVKGLQVLILDYLQLCSSSRRDGNRNAEIEEISRGLKTLAKELGIAVIALSQLNREVEKRANRRPGLSDLRDSGAIEQDADVVMFLWPVREFTEEGRRIVGLAVEKNRQGRLGQIGLDFYGDVQRWTQSVADISPEKAAAPSKARTFE